MKKKKLTKNIILYLINRLGDKIEGKKKLMKLMFLIEHYDIQKKKLIPGGFLGNTFYIYRYGVFSTDIMQCFNELVQEKEIKEGFPLKCTKEIRLENEEIKQRIEGVINKFEKVSGYDLEIETLKMMGIEPYEKERHFGKDVNNLIKN